MADPSSLDVVDLIGLLSKLTGPGALALALIALWRKKVVFGWLYRDALRERDEARAEVKTMNDAIKDQVIPLVTRNLDLLKAIEPRIAPPSANVRDPT